METEKVNDSWGYGWVVLTVPMRNGNEVPEAFQRKSHLGSYRTYEEWKH